MAGITLLQKLQKLYGARAVTDRLGVTTNVQTLAQGTNNPFANTFSRKYLKKNPDGVEEASKVIMENMQFAFGNKNAQQMKNFEYNVNTLYDMKFPPAPPAKAEAQILDLSTKKQVTGKGIDSLKDKMGLPEGVSPDSPMGKIVTSQNRAKKYSENQARQYSANIESYRRPIIRQMLLKDTRINLPDNIRKSLESKMDLSRGADPKMDPLRLLNEYYDVNFAKLDELEDIRFTARNETEAANEFLKKGGLEPKKDLGDKLKDYDGDPDAMAQGGIAGQLHLNRTGYDMGGAAATNLAITQSLKDFKRYQKAGGKLSYKDFIASGKEGVSRFFNEGGRVGLQRGGGLPAVDPRMQNTYAENIAANEAQRVINQVGRQNISNKGNQRALSLASPVATFFAGATPYKDLSALRTEAMDKSLFDIIEKKGTPEGVIGYSDYDTSQTAGSEFPALDQMLKNLTAGKMSAADFANATTLGRLTYKINPDTGKVSFGSNKYDFRPEMADQGGVFGYLAKKANERGININPNVTMPTTQQSDLQKFTAALNAAHQMDSISGLDYQRAFDDYRYNTGNYNMMGTQDSDAITAGTARPFFYAGTDTPRMVSNFQSQFNKPYGYALATGGRVGFKKGGGMDRRTFLKLMGGLASLPVVGKLFKGAKVASKVVPLKNTTTTMPAWFPDLVDKFVAKGVGKKIDQDMMEYTVKELPEVKLLKQDNGAIRVEGKNAYNEEYYIDYEPPGVEVVDFDTGKTVKTKGDFVATDTEYRMISPEDYDVDGVNVNEIDDILGGSSTKLEGFAKGTNKEKYTIGQRRIDEADARGASKDESLRADINDPYGDIDPTDFVDPEDYAKGGLAGQLL